MYVYKLTFVSTIQVTYVVHWTQKEILSELGQHFLYL